jgi:hypothetical protein
MFVTFIFRRTTPWTATGHTAAWAKSQRFESAVSASSEAPVQTWQSAQAPINSASAAATAADVAERAHVGFDKCRTVRNAR